MTHSWRGGAWGYAILVEQHLLLSRINTNVWRPSWKGWMCPARFLSCALRRAANRRGRYLCRGGHQTLLFFFFPVWLPDWVSPNMMGFFQMLINHLRNVTRTFREGTETRRKSKCLGGNWNPGEDRRETCLVALTLNFPQESEGERATKGEMGNLMPFSRLRMPHYLRWCELHQSSLLWSSVLDSGDGGDPLQGWGHSRGALLICLLRGACVTKGIISVFH